MKLGDLMFLKSSEEPVVVLALDQIIEDHPTSKVTVRRPLITTEGTQYAIAEFFRFELETPEEQDIRKIEDIKRRHRLTQAAQKDAGSVQQFDMFAEVDPQAPRN
jgi:hypothetical protein